MQVRDIMVQDVKPCHPDYNLAQVSEIIWKGGSGALPVVDESGQLWNMITDRDICIALGTTNLRPSDVLGVCYTMRRFAQGSMNSARPLLTVLQAAPAVGCVSSEGKETFACCPTSTRTITAVSG